MTRYCIVVDTDPMPARCKNKQRWHHAVSCCASRSTVCIRLPGSGLSAHTSQTGCSWQCGCEWRVKVTHAVQRHHPAIGVVCFLGLQVCQRLEQVQAHRARLGTRSKGRLLVVVCQTANWADNDRCACNDTQPLSSLAPVSNHRVKIAK